MKFWNSRIAGGWGSWDRFIVPRPFAKVRVLVGEPHRVGMTGNGRNFETERLPCRTQ